MTSTQDRPLRVMVILGFGLMAISVSAILIRYASDAPGETVALWRTCFAALLLLPVALLKSRREMAAMSKREWGLILVAGVFLGLHFVTWISSLYHTSIASASVLVSLSPIFMGILGFIVLRERLSSVEIGAISVAIAASAVLAFSAPGMETVGNPLLGNSLALAAAFLVSIYLLIGRVVRKDRSWLAYVAPLYTATALTTLTVALVSGVQLTGFEPRIYLLCLSMAIIPQILGHGAFNYAVRFMPAGTLGLASLFEPVGASFLAFVLFEEVPGKVAAGCMVVILTAVAAALWYRGKQLGTAGSSEAKSMDR